MEKIHLQLLLEELVRIAFYSVLIDRGANCALRSAEQGADNARGF